MKKQIKSSDVLRYVYHETSPEENFWIEKALFEQGNIAVEAFYEFIQMKKDLDKIESTPSKQTINKIMNYARSKNKHTDNKEKQYV